MNEIQKQEERTVYVDMDGVLSDFENHFHQLFSKTVKELQDPELWGLIEQYNKAKFFEGMPWTEGGKTLWEFVISSFPNVRILSALGRTDALDGLTTKGKKAWLAQHIPNLPIEHVILVPNKHRKRHYSKIGNIIIDDNDVVIHEWNAKGGIAIHHKSADETIKQLKKYIV